MQIDRIMQLTLKLSQMRNLCWRGWFEYFPYRLSQMLVLKSVTFCVSGRRLLKKSWLNETLLKLAVYPFTKNVFNCFQWLYFIEFLNFWCFLHMSRSCCCFSFYQNVFNCFQWLYLIEFLNIWCFLYMSRSCFCFPSMVTRCKNCWFSYGMKVRLLKTKQMKS